MDPRKKNIVLGSVAGALLVITAIIFLFRDSLFGTGLPDISPEALEAAKQLDGGADTSTQP